jgi:copper transport protein
MTRFRLVPILLVLLALTAPIVTPAWAHAELLRSLPEANASLDRAPAQVELFFSEALEPSFSRITVLDMNGIAVDNGDSRINEADPTHLTVSLRSLPGGVYTVSWKALSSVDGHVTSGAFPFAVGDVEAAALAAAGQASRQVKLSLGEVAAKWLVYLAAAAIAGGALFVLAVWQPALASLVPAGHDFAESAWRRIGVVALGVLLLGQLLGVLVQAGQASGSEIAAPWSVAVSNVLFRTRYGTLWFARLALTLGLVGLLSAAHPRRRIILGLSLAVLLVISLGSHAAAEPQPALPVLADWAHLLAGSIWIGGLIYFAAGLWAARERDSAFRTRLTARLIPRFSVLGLLSVGTLALSGLYSAVARVGTLEALTGTLYGHALILKLIVALPMVALGAFNLLVSGPSMRQAATRPEGDGRWVTRFRGLVAGEVTLGVGLLLIVAVLTTLPPARIASSAPNLSTAADVDDLSIALDITPGRVGVNTFTLTVTANGQSVDRAQEVQLRFTPLSASVAPGAVQLAALGGGRYAIKGAYLSLPDTWQVKAVIRREGRFDAYADFNIDVGAAAASQTLPWQRLSGGLMIAAALVYAFSFRTFAPHRTRLVAFGLALSAELLIAGVVVFNLPPEAAADPINPIAPNVVSVEAGRAIYQSQCVSCHGAAGKGDGPVGLTLNPRPADLALHAVPGVHADGQLYEWITNGFPGSVMPAFKDKLSEDDRWNLVNFLRTLAPK